MRNCNPRMTGEAYKRPQAELYKRSVPPKAHSFMAALVVWLASYSGAVPTVGAALEQNAAGSNSGPVAAVPFITAKPEHVTLTGGNGSSEIQWDTGNGSMGFVFVTEDGRKPVVFAKGSRGSRMAPWISRHQYVFELYGDNERRTLLAKVTVSGSPASMSSEPTVLWQGVARWVLI